MKISVGVWNTHVCLIKWAPWEAYHIIIDQNPIIFQLEEKILGLLHRQHIDVVSMVSKQENWASIKFILKPLKYTFLYRFLGENDQNSVKTAPLVLLKIRYIFILYARPKAALDGPFYHISVEPLTTNL